MLDQKLTRVASLFCQTILEALTLYSLPIPRNKKVILNYFYMLSTRGNCYLSSCSNTKLVTEKTD